MIIKQRTFGNWLIFSLICVVIWSCSGDTNQVSEHENRSRVTPPDHTAAVILKKITEWYEAVGTVRPGTETVIESQVRAQIKKINIIPGQRIKRGDLIVILDNREVKSRLAGAKQALETARANRKQAEQGLISSQALFKKADLSYTRIKTYYDSQAATTQELESAEASFLQAKAGVSQASEAVKAADSGVSQAEKFIEEIRVLLDYSGIKAPENGVVLKRMAEPGDLAMPGKPLVILRSEGQLILEAFVRESLISKVPEGTRLNALISSADKTVPVTIKEVVPYADPGTRTFLVKASLPDALGLYPGMYGKLYIPVSETEVPVVPEQAILAVGQLTYVLVQTDKGWSKRYVKTGLLHGDQIEITSGVNTGDTIGWRN